ncbi:4-diphosphocytidyl-2-C-methyl-D-erythritol kinase [Nocardioides flavus (ex Wang et al. 2016)]|uniref:4-diphosphocytidyl-2-C-methyl-D-erythritol kinase n=1 Tax=Nocardioides flavus (ex Wang et al. 2016) TaxID=2058780 RepID=A0ABQ3HNK6_9ACTN|nr:4-(cytidine 5'-diphospho)-2-C-methyl-D-erythritol kinase [Nocardioides flavus (ex Wang et al. 2016)]GHE19250.1 4-diphosphocytidyl-2-C-methyl-D-erythritol kinase [Nocardioides flavus (ex Wang et al. 2016)]
MSVTVRAAAKINLHLGVGAPREDGFHPLDTVYQAIDLYDDLTLSVAGEDSLTVAGPPYVDVDGIPTDASNIAMRALAEVACGDAHAVRISKRVPVAGGMAGGSADGAAALLAHDRLHVLDQSDEVLLAQAARLGSDVPFSLVGGTARGRGRGEVVERIEDLGTWWWVVVPASVGLSTPEVYRHFDRLHPDAPAQPAEPTGLLAALATGEPVRLARTLHNDLEEPAIDLRPELGTLIERGEAEGALRGMVSGSGPTCVFLCAGRDEAMAVAAGLSATYDVVLPAVGPVAGAHVVHPG